MCQDFERKAFDPDFTVVGINVPYDRHENLLDKAKELVYNVLQLDIVKITQSRRLHSRGERPGILKTEVQTIDMKVEILRNKHRLKDSRGRFRNVYLRSSQSHTERIHLMDMKTVLDELPTGNQFRIAGNGKVICKEPVADILNKNIGYSEVIPDSHPDSKITIRG